MSCMGFCLSGGDETVKRLPLIEKVAGFFFALPRVTLD